jgi:hypothetical protein
MTPKAWRRWEIEGMNPAKSLSKLIAGLEGLGYRDGEAIATAMCWPTTLSDVEFSTLLDTSAPTPRPTATEGSDSCPIDESADDDLLAALQNRAQALWRLFETDAMLMTWQRQRGAESSPKGLPLAGDVLWNVVADRMAIVAAKLDKLRQQQAGLAMLRSQVSDSSLPTLSTIRAAFDFDGRQARLEAERVSHYPLLGQTLGIVRFTWRGVHLRLRGNRDQ